MNPFSSNKSILAENIRATSADSETRRWLNSKKRMCWKCQKETPRKEGTLTKFYKTRFSNADKFICRDCTAKKEIKE